MMQKAQQLKKLRFADKNIIMGQLFNIMQQNAALIDGTCIVYKGTELYIFIGKDFYDLHHPKN